MSREFTVGLLLLCFLSTFAHAEDPKEIPDNWKRFHKYGFAMRTPPGYEYKAMLGVDSFLGVFEAEQVFVVFDFGWYSDLTKTHRGKKGIKERAVTVDGQPGFIWQLTDEGRDPYQSDEAEGEALPKVMILNIPKIRGGEDGLWVRVRYKDERQEVQIQRMLKSITFLPKK